VTGSVEVLETPVPTVVWDLPVRLTHWGLVALVATCWATAEAGLTGWHRAAGFGVLWLVLFRLYWGFSGSASARFRGFLRGPRTVAAYARTWLRKEHFPSVGHNPLGGWNVALLLMILGLQVALGLFAVDEFGLESGPLARHISFELGREVAGWHAVVFNVLASIIALHVGAVAAYLFFRRENLVAPMLTGRKPLTPRQAKPLHLAPRWRAVAGLAGSGAIVAALAFLV
jgi:cytochrome b